MRRPRRTRRLLTVGGLIAGLAFRWRTIALTGVLIGLAFIPLGTATPPPAPPGPTVADFRAQLALERQRHARELAVERRVSRLRPPATGRGALIRQARALAKHQHGWGRKQFVCLVRLWDRESRWRPAARNRRSGAYGIPQALPASKIRAAGDGDIANPITQMLWGMDYIRGRYRTPCRAWSRWQQRLRTTGHGWY